MREPRAGYSRRENVSVYDICYRYPLFNTQEECVSYFRLFAMRIKTDFKIWGETEGKKNRKDATRASKEKTDGGKLVDELMKMEKGLEKSSKRERQRTAGRIGGEEEMEIERGRQDRNKESWKAGRKNGRIDRHGRNKKRGKKEGKDKGNTDRQDRNTEEKKEEKGSTDSQDRAKKR